jgi:hypothetical protein
LTEVLVRSRVWSPALVALCIAAVVAAFATAPPSARAATAHQIRPGSVVTIAGVKCKVGLLLHKAKTVYVAIPASCGALPLDEGTPQNGCQAASAPIGTPVKVAGARHRGVLVYDSFTRMESLGTKSSDKCHYNDFALVRLNPKDAKHAVGTIPGMDAPHRISRQAPASGSSVSVGSSSATAGTATHRGWVYPLSGTGMAQVTASDVGTPVVQGGRLLGMLTAIPQGIVTKTDAAAYNLCRAIRSMHHMRGFHHVQLLRAGQHT